MLTIIDELVIKLAFEVEGLKQRGGEADAQLKKLRDSAETTGKDMENSGKRAAQFFAAAKVEALALVSVLTGGAGLLDALYKGASSIADFGRAATNLNGMDPSRLDAWGQALKRIGGNAQDAATSFSNVAAAIANYTLKGNGAIIPFLRAIGAQTTQTPEQIALRFSEYIKEHPEKTAAEINVIGQGLGMTQSMTNLLRQGPAGVNRELELSNQLGLITKPMIETATKFQHDFEALHQAVGHLVDRLETAAMPTVADWMNWVTGFVTTHPDAATGIGVGGAVVSGAAGSSIIARILGLGGLADAFAALTSLILKFTGAFGLLTGLSGDTGPNSGGLSDAEADAVRRNAEAQGILTPGQALRRWWSGTPSTGGSNESVGAPITTGERGQNADTAIAFFKSKGYSDEQIAGILGNLQAESGFNPLVPENAFNRGHLGIAQWDATRQAQFKAKFGHAMNDPSISKDQLYNEQLQFVDWELRHGYKGILRGPQTAGQAAAALNEHYEVSGTNSAGRSAAAEHWYQIIRARLAPPATTPLFQLPPQPRSQSYFYNPMPGGAQSASVGSNDNSTSLQVDTINVHTAATNASGIAKEIHGALADQMIQQANRGLS